MRWTRSQVGSPAIGPLLASRAAPRPGNPEPLGINQTRPATESLNIKQPCSLPDLLRAAGSSPLPPPVSFNPFHYLC